MGNLISYMIDATTTILQGLRKIFPSANPGMPVMGLTTGATGPSESPQAPIQPETQQATQPAAGGTSTTSPGTISSSTPGASLSDMATASLQAELEGFKRDLEGNPDLAAQSKVKHSEVFEGPQLPEGYVPPNSSDGDGEKDRKALEKWYEDMSDMGYLYYWNTVTRESVWVVSEKYFPLADRGLERAPSSQNEEPVVEKQEEQAELEGFKRDLEGNPDLAAQSKVKHSEVFEGPQLPEGYVPPNSSDGDGEKDRKALEKWYEDMSDMGYLYYWNTVTRESVWVVSEKYFPLADRGLERAPSSQNEEPVVEKQEEQGIRVRHTQPIPQQPAAGASGGTRPKTRQRNSFGRKQNGARRKSNQENFEVPEGTGLIKDFRLKENPNLPVYRSNAAVPDKDVDENRKRRPDQTMYTLPMKR